MPRQTRSNAPKKLCGFYLTELAKKKVEEVAERLHVTLSAYCASAVLREAQAAGAGFHGEVRRGLCARAAPERSPRGPSGLPASWWNRYGLNFFCEPCARQLNAMEPGVCVLAEEEEAAPPIPPPIPGS